jgi:pyruvate kinase
METITKITNGWHADQLVKLAEDLGDIRSEMLEVEKSFAHKRHGIGAERDHSARNLLHYLALRRRDIRPLQERLARYGLSSLGRAESHVLANLDAALKIVCHLSRRQFPGPAPEADADFSAGKYALENNTAALLGPKPEGRDVRIMVTMPSEAATDYDLVRNLVNAGMDCMRINCAHDDKDAWAHMIENLGRAKRQLSKGCRVVMDLPGPKLRTGPVEPMPGVVKWRPRRDRYGGVVEPAQVWLTAKDNSHPSAAGAGARLIVPRDWLTNLRSGDTIKFLDARGSSRSMEVKEASADGCLAESSRTAYLTSGTMLHVIRSEGGKRMATEVASIEDIPPQPQSLRLKPGDILILTRNPDLGLPAVYDPQGKLLQPATIGVTLPEIFADVQPEEAVWFDDGKIGGVIRSVTADAMEVEITKCRSKGDNLREDKGINLPDSNLRLPALTEQDVEHLSFIATHADLVGYSFVRHESDVEKLQAQLKRVGGEHLGIVLKIETRKAFERLPHLILAALRSHAAGLMIARGDLAVECGYERMGELQEEILWIAEAAHMPVIWATQVLENLARTNQPSRAEITDVAMGERAECIMLNKGPYIAQAVQAADDILRRMQAHQSKKISLLRPLNLADRFCSSQDP